MKLDIELEEVKEIYKKLEGKGYVQIDKHLIYYDYAERDLETLAQNTLEEVTVENEVAKLEEDFFEKTPDLMGSPVKDAINWLKEFKIIHLQLLNPYEYNIYLQRLEEIIKEYSLKTLEKYNLESTNGTNLENLYQDLLQETLLKNVKIEGVKLSLGEYKLKVILDGKSYYLNCRSSDTREMVMEEIKNEIIIPVMEDMEAKDDSNNTNYENTKEMI